MAEDRYYTIGEFNTLNAAKAWLRSKKAAGGPASPIAETRLVLATQQLFDEQMRARRERKAVKRQEKQIVSDDKVQRIRPRLRIVPGGKR
jgi:hypothetical protein